MGHAYMGKVLRVDLSSGDIQEEVIPEEVYKKYLSGLGLGAYMLYKNVPAGADPLGPDNMLGFLSGLLTSTGSLFTGRWMLVGKSPLTGGWGDANCGGTFSPAIKRCGYDGIFFTGVSEKPVYLLVEKGKAELRDASDLWGKDTVETEEILVDRAGSKKKPKVACIGPAGETLSLISGVSNDRGRMAARSGLGAVMGSKKLKAVVLSGVKKVEPYDRAEMKRLSKKCNKWVQFQPPFISGPLMAYVGVLLRVLPTQLVQDGLLYKFFLRKWGTVSMNQASVEMGDSPIKNWGGTNKDFGTKKSNSVNADVFTDCETVKYHCYSCPLGCGGICAIADKTGGKFSETHKPEYETVLAIGGLCMNENADSIFYMNELLNRAGMDSISAGGTLAFAIECYENAILTKEDTGGLELTWGNSQAIVALLEKMIARDGIGDLLADGVKVAADKLGLNAKKYAIHAGGQELPMHDGRNDPGYNLHYYVEPTPGRHTIGAGLYYEMYQLWKRVKTVPRIGLLSMLYHKDKKYVASEEKAAIGAANSKYMSLLNGAGACMFAAFLGTPRFPIFEWFNAATGWDKTPETYMEIGANIQTLRQAFNVKHGINPKDVNIPPRTVGRPPVTEGANKGRTMEMEKMIENYWEEFGWDRHSGKPAAVTPEEMGID
jgi:aldehyde:ferredoxin oxidoreductase